MDSLERGAEALDKMRQAMLTGSDLSSSNTVGDAQPTQPQQLNSDMAGKLGIILFLKGYYLIV